MNNIEHYNKSLIILAAIIIALGSCCKSGKESKELKNRVLGTLVYDTCNYTIDKDTIVLGAIMYEISVFKMKPINVLKNGKTTE